MNMNDTRLAEPAALRDRLALPELTKRLLIPARCIIWLPQASQ